MNTSVVSKVVNADPRVFMPNNGFTRANTKVCSRVYVTYGTSNADIELDLLDPMTIAPSRCYPQR